DDGGAAVRAQAALHAFVAARGLATADALLRYFVLLEGHGSSRLRGRIKKMVKGKTDTIGRSGSLASGSPKKSWSGRKRRPVTGGGAVELVDHRGGRRHSQIRAHQPDVPGPQVLVVRHQ